MPEYTPMNRLIQATRDQKTGHIDKLEFFQDFFDVDLSEQLAHLKNLLETCEEGRK